MLRSPLRPPLQPVLRSAFARGVGGSTLSQQVAAIYAAGRLGPWFDPSDLSTMYTTRAGATLVGTPGNGTAQFVGRILDKSGGGYHALAPNDTTARPQLSARVNLFLATATLATQSVTTVATDYTLYFAGAGTITLSGTATGAYLAGSHTITCTAGTLTATVSGAVTAADIRPTNIHATGSIPAYQLVTSAEDYDSVGFPYYLAPNGTGQSMVTSAITPGTNSITWGVGVRKLAEATGMILEHSASAAANNGAFYTYQNTGGQIETGQKGTAFAALTPATYVAPTTAIVVARAVISTPVYEHYRNGVSALSGSASLGTGNFLTHAINLFARNGASLWFGGRYYGSIVLFGPQLSVGELAIVQAWLESKTRVWVPGSSLLLGDGTSYLILADGGKILLGSA